MSSFFISKKSVSFVSAGSVETPFISNEKKLPIKCQKDAKRRDNTASRKTKMENEEDQNFVFSSISLNTFFYSKVLRFRIWKIEDQPMTKSFTYFRKKDEAKVHKSKRSIFYFISWGPFRRIKYSLQKIAISFYSFVL